MLIGKDHRSVSARRGGVLSVLVFALSGCTVGSGGTPQTAAPTTTTQVRTTSTTSTCTNRKVLAGWPNSELAAQVVVVPASDAAPLAVSSLVAGGAGGVILFGSNPTSQLAGQLAQLKTLNTFGVAPSIMSDEEGGAVQRLTVLTGPIPSAREMGATMSASQIETLAKSLAIKLSSLGLTVDLAPVLDVDGGPGPSNTNPDGTRSFSADPAVAAKDGLAFAKGLIQGGITPVVKHFPGLGGATGNTDVMSASTPPLSTLLTVGLVPFRAAIAAGLPAVMISNASVPGITAKPASLSKAAVSYLRNVMGFKGTIITDSLSAQSISNLGLSVPQAAVESIGSGTDLVLYNTLNPALTFKQTVDALVAAVSDGTLARRTLLDAVESDLSFKGVDLCVG